jgi:hypothetical protein
MTGPSTDSDVIQVRDEQELSADDPLRKNEQDVKQPVQSVVCISVVESEKS